MSVAGSWGGEGFDHHLPNHDQTIIATAMTSAILTKTSSTLRSLSRLSFLRSRGSGRFVGIIGSPLRVDHPHSLSHLIALRTPVRLSCAWRSGDDCPRRVPSTFAL